MFSLQSTSLKKILFFEHLHERPMNQLSVDIENCRVAQSFRTTSAVAVAYRHSSQNRLMNKMDLLLVTQEYDDSW